MANVGCNSTHTFLKQHFIVHALCRAVVIFSMLPFEYHWHMENFLKPSSVCLQPIEILQFCFMQWFNSCPSQVVALVTEKGLVAVWCEVPPLLKIINFDGTIYEHVNERNDWVGPRKNALMKWKLKQWSQIMRMYINTITHYTNAFRAMLRDLMYRRSDKIRFVCGRFWNCVFHLLWDNWSVLYVKLGRMLAHSPRLLHHQFFHFQSLRNANIVMKRNKCNFYACYVTL